MVGEQIGPLGCHSRNPLLGLCDILHHRSIVDREWNLDRIFRLLLGAGIAVALFLLIDRLSGVLLPFLVALLLAYLLNPIVDFFQKYVKKRVLAIISTFIILTAALVGIWFLVVPSIVEEFRVVQKFLVGYTQQIEQNPGFMEFEHKILSYFNQDELTQLLSYENITAVSQKLLPELWSGIGSIFSWLMGLVGIVTITLYFFFISMDFKSFKDRWRDYIPPKWKDHITTLAMDLEQGMQGYFKQQSKIVLIVGILFAIGFKIIGLPLAISLGLFVGLLNYVPYLQLVGLIPCTLAAALLSLDSGQNFWWIMLWVVVVFSVVQLIQEAVLVPRFMGDLTGMNPAIILLSLSIWGSLLGVTGMIIALPITTIIISYYRRIVLKENDD